MNGNVSKRLTATEKTIITGLEGISRFLELKDPELQAKMSIVTPTPLQEVGLPALDLAINKTANKVPAVVNAVTWLFNQNSSFEKRLQELEAQTRKLDAEKADKELVDQKFEDLMAGIDKRFEALGQNMNERFEEMQKSMKESVETTITRMGEVEVATLWRIQDCEELLKSRTSEKYVKEALKDLEERLRAEVVSFLFGEIGRFSKEADGVSSPKHLESL